MSNYTSLIGSFKTGASQLGFGPEVTTIVSSQTQNGIARITANTSRTQTGLSRITVESSKTLTGLSRLQVISGQTQSGISRIQGLDPREQLGIARIQVKQLRTQTGIAKLQIQQHRIQNGEARIQVRTLRTQTGITRIFEQNVRRSITGIARLTGNTEPVFLNDTVNQWLQKDNQLIDKANSLSNIAEIAIVTTVPSPGDLLVFNGHAFANVSLRGAISVDGNGNSEIVQQIAKGRIRFGSLN